MTRSPVALITFNRPRATEAVFARIAQARPPVLFVIADGPRPDHPEDAERCAAARAATENVTWDCDVRRDYSAANLGCGRRPATGISWVFQQVDRAIILEDDCVPDPSFFGFCDEMLDRFASTSRVMHVAGSNFVRRRRAAPHSYRFSIHNVCHGWATWQRAWQHFDPSVPLWPTLRGTRWLAELVDHERAAEYWQRQFDRAHRQGGEADLWGSWAWDYQWTFACWAHDGLSVTPNQNLISNIGFGPDATHTRGAGDVRARLPTEPMRFPLSHPPAVVADRAADRAFIKTVVEPGLPPPSTVYWKLRRAVVGALPDSMRRRLRALVRANGARSYVGGR